jgi:hypothetical protein
MAKSKRYYGHKNWAHWSVSLWLYNDEKLYNLMLDAVRYTKTKAEATEYLLSVLPYATPDGARYSRAAVRAALVGLGKTR